MNGSPEGGKPNLHPDWTPARAFALSPVVFPRDSHEPRLLTWLRNPKVRRSVILTCLWLFIAVVLLAFRRVLLPFGLALLLAFIIEPAVAFLCERPGPGRRLPRVVAVLGLYAVVLTGLWLFGSWAVAQVGRELANLGSVTKHIVAEVQAVSMSVLARAERFAEENAIPVDRAAIEGWLQHNLTGATTELSENASSLLTFGRNLVAGVFTTIFGAFLVLMLTAFLSIDRARIERFFASLVPPERGGAYDSLKRAISIGLAGVVRGQVTICLLNGVLTFVGLWLLQVKLPMILASIATVFSLIPIFGSILSTLPIVAMALTDDLTKGVLALLWIIGIHLVEANFLNPKIMGDAAKIHPVVVVFVLIVGESTAGLIGALFAVPIAAVVLTFFKHLHRRALEAEASPTTEDLLEARPASAPAAPLAAEPPR